MSLASDGSHNDLLVNTIGKYKGTVLFDKYADEHSVAFDISADGAWTVVIKPATEAQPWDGTSPLKGTSDDVVMQSPPSSGLITLDLTYVGKGNFAVIAFTPEGADLLANEIGNFTGTVVEPNGTFLLEISADGAWTITPG